MNFIEISRGIVILALIIEAIIDIRKKKIWIPLCLMCSAIVVIIQQQAGSSLLETLVWGIVIALGFYMISIITREQIGKGDAYLFGMAACTLEAKYFLEMVYICFFMTFLVALFMVLVLKKKKNDSLPLAPFVAVSYALIMIF